MQIQKTRKTTAVIKMQPEDWEDYYGNKIWPENYNDYYGNKDAARGLRKTTAVTIYQKTMKTTTVTKTQLDD